MATPIGLILGTGWGKIIADLKSSKKVPYKNIFGAAPSIPGHAGQVITAKYKNKNLIILSGRFHTYEGYSAHEATKTVRYLHKEGVKKIIITSAVGALNPKYKVGDLVILKDMITLFCQSPLIGPKYQDLSVPFSEKLQNLAIATASSLHIPFQSGIHVFVNGPHFETAADKMTLRQLGADVVGMSIVPEVIMGRNLNMEVLGLSLITNLAFVKHSHEDVLAAAKKQEKNLYEFIKKLIIFL